MHLTVSPTWDDDKDSETGSLTRATLPLNRHYLHDLIFEAGEEGIDDLGLLDWEVDLL